MPIHITRFRQRMPILTDIAVREGWMDAYLFDGLLSVHRAFDVRLRSQGLWAVTLAGCGQGIDHFPSQEEAEAFAGELLSSGIIEANYRNRLDVPVRVMARLGAFIHRWRTQRRFQVMPKFQSQLAIPEGLQIHSRSQMYGWNQFNERVRSGVILGPDGRPIKID
jgi:hypothetical protein